MSRPVGGVQTGKRADLRKHAFWDSSGRGWAARDRSYGPENEGDTPLTIITGLADENTELIVEVGFEVSDVGNVVVYHAMEARPKYR